MIAASWLTGTCDRNDSVQDDRYFYAENTDDLHSDVERPYRLLDSLNIDLCNAPDTGLNVTAQDSSSYQIRSVQQLHTTNGMNAQ